MTKYYTVATKIHKTYGHGDYGDELVIETEEAYGVGYFPPLFHSKEEARNYIMALEAWDRHSKEVVIVHTSSP